MAEDRLMVRRVAWREICPWLMIFRSFALAISLPVLFLAIIGTLATWGGRMWTGSFPYDPDQPFVAADLQGVVESSTGGFPLQRELLFNRWVGREGVSGVYWFFVDPVWDLFDRTASTTDFLRNLVVTLLNIGVWALIGGAITRIAVVQFGREERLSTVEAFRHAFKNWGWYFAAPLFPLLGVALLLLPFALLGLLMRTDVMVFLAGLLWPLALIGGLIIAILLLGLLAGWPLMWPTISAEPESDAFEAFNRSYSYSFQRPLRYLAYAFVALALGWLSWFLVDQFASAVIALTHWGISFGAGNQRVIEVLGGAEEPSSLLRGGIRLVAWWDWLVRVIAQAFNFSFFFCAASAIYLLLRREVDQKDFDEVYLPDEQTRYGLPPLQPGPAGVPEVAEPARNEQSGEAAP